MHRQSKAREAQLLQQIEELEAKVRLRERQLFGRKSEQGSKSKPDGGKTPDNKDEEKRKRGQQPGTRGHGRRTHEHLPAKDVDCRLAQSDCVCEHCGLPYEELPWTEDSQEVVVEVKAHRRVIKRRCYQPPDKGVRDFLLS